MTRPSLSGKFLATHQHRLLITGVGYGMSSSSGAPRWPNLQGLPNDFERIRGLGANAVRTFSPPPRRLMDEAERRGLHVIAGVPWPPSTAFLDTRESVRRVTAEVRRHVRGLASHAATLMVAVGNEVSPRVVRWYGRRRIEAFLKELYEEAKSVAPDLLVTYFNSPATEYLDLPFFDVCSFALSIPGEEELRAYLARLQHIAGPRPLLIAEADGETTGGAARPSLLLGHHLNTVFAEGACGAIGASWPIECPRFQTRSDAVHPPIRTVQTPDERHTAWPTVSVVVCAYNAARTIDACLSAIEALRYPNFDVIVVNDGSSDETGTIAARHTRVAVIHTPNSGLAAARNVGLRHATGDIVAYTDADTRVDPDWLTYLVQPFLSSDVVAAGGPNIVPPDDPWFAQCVARAPGGPTHVLFDDRLAEHVPGCNIAFRRDALAAIGGFNPIFLRAGDDVDVCWRLLARDWKIGFAPAALVWHHHRASLRAYLRQQVGYGEGEAWLMPEHPDKFVSGLIAWRGHIYSSLPFLRSLSATRVNAGPFGSAAFPSVYRTRCHPFTYLPHSESWQIGWVLLLLAAAAFGLVERPFAPVVLCVALTALLVTVTKDVLYGLRSDIRSLPRVGRLPGWASRGVQRLTIAALHFLQPFARLHGRFRGRLYMPARHPERRHREPSMRSGLAVFARAARFVLFRRVEVVYERHAWIDLQTVWLGVVERLRARRAVRQVEIDSGWWEDHDLTIVDRFWFRLDVRGLVEDHGERWLLRLATRLRFTPAVVWPVAVGTAIVVVFHFANVVSWPLGAAMAALLAAGPMAWNVATTLIRLEDAVSDTAGSMGMRRFKPLRRRNARVTDRSGMDVAVSR